MSALPNSLVVAFGPGMSLFLFFHNGVTRANVSLWILIALAQLARRKMLRSAPAREADACILFSHDRSSHPPSHFYSIATHKRPISSRLHDPPGIRDTIDK